MVSSRQARQYRRNAIIGPLAFRKRVWYAGPVNREDWQFVGFTVRMALLSTVVMAPFGLALAWCLARPGWRGKSLLDTLVTLPLVLPPVLTGLVLLKLFG